MPELPVPISRWFITSHPHVCDEFGEPQHMVLSSSLGHAPPQDVPPGLLGTWWGHSPTWQDGTSMKPFRKFPRGLFSDDCKRRKKRER